MLIECLVLYLGECETIPGADVQPMQNASSDPDPTNFFETVS